MDRITVVLQYNPFPNIKTIQNTHKQQYVSTGLWHGCREGHLDVIELLSQHNIDWNVKGMYGMAPMCIACQYSSLDIVRFLHNHGGNVNIASSVCCLCGFVESGFVCVFLFRMDRLHCFGDVIQDRVILFFICVILVSIILIYKTKVA